MANAYEIYTNYLFSIAGNHGIPLSGTFELTSRCNLDCKMCYIHKKANDKDAIKKEKTTEQWISLAKECKDAGTLIMLLTGGEPFIRPDFKEIYTACKNMGMLVSINSNATLLDDKMLDFLISSPPSRINITLYGASPETYGVLCGNPSVYERVIHAILTLHNAGVLVKLNFSVTPYNKQDADKIYAFSKEHGIPIQTATYMFPPVRACENGCFKADRMTPYEAAKEQIRYDRFRFEEQILKERWASQLKGIRVKDPDRTCLDIPSEKIGCRAGSSTFWITWDGKMRLCGMTTVPNIELEEGHFKDAWEHLRKMRENIMVPAKCTACNMRHVCDQCPALCYAETGSFIKVPEYACQKTRAYLDMIEQESI